MAIVGSVFAMLGRFAGRLLNSALGWATLLLFGKVEGRKQTLLLVIALASLVWVLVVVGVAFPEAGVFLLAFVPIPDFVDENVVRLVMLGLALVIPLLIGIAAIYVTSPEQRPNGLHIVTSVLRGYPFTLVLALTIVLLAVVSLIRKVRSLAKRWSDAHVPVVVKPGGYERVLADLEAVIDRAGLDVQPKPAPAVLSLPPRLLDRVAGKALGGLVPDRLMTLNGRELEVLVYPSDVAIAGSKDAMARARAAIAAELTDSPAYLTTSAESERVEDEIRKVADARHDAESGDAAALRRRLRELDREIARLPVPFDEWETVYRQRLQVERDLLARQVPGENVAGGANLAREGIVGRVVAIAGVALIALDALLLLADRRSRRRT
jgi:hypothetical protein